MGRGRFTRAQNSEHRCSIIRASQNRQQQLGTASGSTLYAMSIGLLWPSENALVLPPQTNPDSDSDALLTPIDHRSDGDRSVCCA